MQSYNYHSRSYGPCTFSDVSSSGSFDFSDLVEDQVIGSGSSVYSDGISNFYVDVQIKVYSFGENLINVGAIITDTNDPNLSIGGIGGGYQMFNLSEGGVSVYTLNPLWAEGTTSWEQTGELTISGLFFII